MAHLRKEYYYKDDIPKELRPLYAGFDILRAHPLFSQLDGTVICKKMHMGHRHSIACVTKSGNIYVNVAAGLTAPEWAYVLAHNLLHLAFGHFDLEKMPPTARQYPAVWNKACDIYVARFLADAGFGKAILEDPAKSYTIRLNEEKKIYEHLLAFEGGSPAQDYGLNDGLPDLIGLEAPLIYKDGAKNEYTAIFTQAITSSIRQAVDVVSGRDPRIKNDTPVCEAAEWFLAHYPLLGVLNS